jgi:stage II sporulation protein AA (anti-sigma F factor antagonist)
VRPHRCGHSSNVASHEVKDPASRVELVSRRMGQSLKLAIAGELDMAATFKLEPELDRLLDAPDLRRLECDLAGVSFVDSSGLGLLLAMRERTHDRGIAMAIVSVSAPVRRILDVSGIGTVLKQAEPSSRRETSQREVE